MKQERLPWVMYAIVMVFVLAACDNSNTTDNIASTEAVSTEQQVDLLTIDVPVFDPDGYYMFENPGSWTIFESLNLSDPGNNIKVAVLVNPEDSVPFEEYVESWTEEDYEVKEAENGWAYTVTVAGGSPTILIESADGVHWMLQIQEQADGAELEDYIDEVLAIGLTANYILRETEE